MGTMDNKVCFQGNTLYKNQLASLYQEEMLFIIHKDTFLYMYWHLEKENKGKILFMPIH